MIMSTGCYLSQKSKQYRTIALLLRESAAVEYSVAINKSCQIKSNRIEYDYLVGRHAIQYLWLKYATHNRMYFILTNVLLILDAIICYFCSDAVATNWIYENQNFDVASKMICEWNIMANVFIWPCRMLFVLRDQCLSFNGRLINFNRQIIACIYSNGKP